MSSNKLRLLLPAALLIVFSGCYWDKADKLYPASPICNTDSVTYSGTVKAIFYQNCALSGCHDAATASGGVVLETLSGAQAAAKNGSLLGAINHDPAYVAMPQNAPKLDDCTIRQISKWVADGAPAN
jgi:hypothetical protein